MPDIRFDQGDTGTVNRSRSDIALGVELDIVALNVVGTAVFGVLGRSDSTSVAVLSGTGTTRQFTPDKAGSYRIRIVDDNDGSDVIHTFTVLTPLGQHIPAPNERADADANDVDADPTTWVDNSETNEGGSFEGWHPAMFDNATLLEAQILLRSTPRSRKFYVDLNTPAATTADEDGSEALPFKTIGQAVVALPAPLGTNVDLQNALFIYIAPGEYDEDVTIDISGRQLCMVTWEGEGAWKLGTFNGSASLPSGTRRDITITGSHTVTDFVNPVFAIAAPGASATLPSSFIPNISGSIIDTVTVTGGNLLMRLQAVIYGQLGTGESVNLSATTTVFCEEATFISDIVGAGAWRFLRCDISGDVNVGAVIYCIQTGIGSPTWEVAFSFVFSISGFIDCFFSTSTVFTGPAGSFQADATSAQTAEDAGVTFVTATLDLRGGQRYEDAGTPVTRAITTNFTGAGVTVTAPATVLGAMTVDIPGAAGTFLPLAGGTMSGAINMGGNSLTEVGGVSAPAGDDLLISSSVAGGAILATIGSGEATLTAAGTGETVVESQANNVRINAQSVGEVRLGVASTSQIVVTVNGAINLDSAGGRDITIAPGTGIAGAQLGGDLTTSTGAGRVDTTNANIRGGNWVHIGGEGASPTTNLQPGVGGGISHVTGKGGDRLTTGAGEPSGAMLLGVGVGGDSGTGGSSNGTESGDLTIFIDVGGQPSTALQVQGRSGNMLLETRAGGTLGARSGNISFNTNDAGSDVFAVGGATGTVIGTSGRGGDGFLGGGNAGTVGWRGGRGGDVTGAAGGSGGIGADVDNLAGDGGDGLSALDIGGAGGDNNSGSGSGGDGNAVSGTDGPGGDYNITVGVAGTGGFTPSTDGAFNITVSGTTLVWPAADGSAGQFMTTDGAGNLSFTMAAGGGDFVGPGSSTTGNLVSFGDATGKLGADSGVAASDVATDLQTAYNGGQAVALLAATGNVTWNATDAVSWAIQKAAANVIAMDTAGAVDITPTSGQIFNVTTAGVGGEVILDAGGDDLRLRTGGLDRFFAGATGFINIQGGTDQEVAVRTSGTGNARLLSTGTGNVEITATAGNVEIDATAGFVAMQQGGANRVLAAAIGTVTLSPEVDQGAFIQTSGTGVININANGTGSIEVDATAGSIDLQITGATKVGVTSAGAVNVTPTSGQSFISNVDGAGVTQFQRNGANRISIDASGGVDLQTGAGQNLTLDAATTGIVTISSATGSVALQRGGANHVLVTTAGAVTVTPTSTQDFNVTATGTGGAINLQTSGGGASHIMINALGGGNVNIESVSGGVSLETAGDIIFNAPSTGAALITPTSGQAFSATTAGAGGITLSAPGTGALSLTAAGGVTTLTGTVLDLQATVSSALISAVGDATLRSTAGSVFIEATGASDAVSITANGDTSIDSTTGNVSLDAVAGQLQFDDIGNSGLTLSQASDLVLTETAAGEVQDGTTSFIAAINRLSESLVVPRDFVPGETSTSGGTPITKCTMVIPANTTTSNQTWELIGACMIRSSSATNESTVDIFNLTSDALVIALPYRIEMDDSDNQNDSCYMRAEFTQAASAAAQTIELRFFNSGSTTFISEAGLTARRMF